MLDDVLEDVKTDYRLVAESYDPAGAVGAIRQSVIKYMATGQMSYAEGIRMVCCILLILVAFKKEKQNGSKQ